MMEADVFHPSLETSILEAWAWPLAWKRCIQVISLIFCVYELHTNTAEIIMAQEEKLCQVS